MRVWDPETNLAVTVTGIGTKHVLCQVGAEEVSYDPSELAIAPTYTPFVVNVYQNARFESDVQWRIFATMAEALEDPDFGRVVLQVHMTPLAHTYAIPVGF